MAVLKVRFKNRPTYPDVYLIDETEFHPDHHELHDERKQEPVAQPEPEPEPAPAHEAAPAVEPEPAPEPKPRRKR